MKTQDVTQNVIVKLDFNELNKIIREQDKNGRLLGSQGLFKNYSWIDDQIILHRFAYLKGTMDAVDLLGIILSNIDLCLKFVYYFEYKDMKLQCYGYYDEGGLTLEDIMYGQVILEDNKKEIYEYVNDNEKEIIIECNKMSKYYKEYYTRLFDRGRTVK